MKKLHSMDSQLQLVLRPRQTRSAMQKCLSWLALSSIHTLSRLFDDHPMEVSIRIISFPPD